MQLPEPLPADSPCGRDAPSLPAARMPAISASQAEALATLPHSRAPGQPWLPAIRPALTSPEQANSRHQRLDATCSSHRN
jgi:hypothetical protein